MNIQQFYEEILEMVRQHIANEYAEFYEPGTEYHLSNCGEVHMCDYGPMPYFHELGHSGISEFMPKVIEDFTVDFDFENCDYYHPDIPNFPPDMIGFQNWLPFPFFGFIAGGDWELSVYCIIWHDGTNFRGYIPEPGNLYNRLTMEAYGNRDEGEDSDDVDARNRGYIDYRDLTDKANFDFDVMRQHLIDWARGMGHTIVTYLSQPLEE